MIHVRFNGFVLDEARFELRHDGAVVAVQPKVLELILYLVRHRDRVVGKDELFETVWDGTVVTEASLSQALSLARRALDDSARTQHTIVTVRRKGLRFVAPIERGTVEPQPMSNPVPASERVSGATLLETAEATQDRTRAEPETYLEVILHGPKPRAGGASYALSGVNEVRLQRGSARRLERARSEQLQLSLPGAQLSRNHARLERRKAAWWVVDEGSRNGTFVVREGAEPERIAEHRLSAGDVVEVGGTFLRVTTSTAPLPAPIDVDRLELGYPFTTVTPDLVVLAQSLRRVAASAVPILIAGPSGSGKSHLAEQLHRISERAGPCVTLDADLVNDGRLRDALTSAQSGTVIVDGADRLPPAAAGPVAAVLERATDVRVLATSTQPFAELRSTLGDELATRLAGYRCALPPLTHRLGDLGVLVAAIATREAVDITLSSAAARALLRHDWPGNLRELTHTLVAAAHLSRGRIDAQHLPPEIHAPA